MLTKFCELSPVKQRISLNESLWNFLNAYVSLGGWS